MATFQCNCGLIISTPGHTAECVRCHRVLGPRNRVAPTRLPGRIDGSSPSPTCHIIRLARDDTSPPPELASGQQSLSPPYGWSHC